MSVILVVDDEPKVLHVVEAYLREAGFEVLTARDGESALATAKKCRPELVVLDLGLPGLDGLEVTRALRADWDVPIVMLTARVDEVDKIVGLELGADDYVTKPFSPRELVARVRGVLRRSGRGARVGSARIVAGDLSLDVARMRVEVSGTVVQVTAVEFQLLAALARRPGHILTRAQLLDAIHGNTAAPYERAIDTHIKNLRRKIEPDPARPRYLLTSHGVGYRFADDA